MRELSRLFRAYCHDKHTTWIDLIPHINEWLIKVPHESTGKSAYEVHWGEKPPKEFPELTSKLLPDNDETRTNEERLHIVRRNLEAAGRRRRKYGQSKTYLFHEGQNVLLRVPKPSNLAGKLYHNFFLLYEGPFKVYRVPNVNVAELVDNEGMSRGQFNFRSLKPYYQGQESSP